LKREHIKGNAELRHAYINLKLYIFKRA